MTTTTIAQLGVVTILNAGVVVDKTKLNALSASEAAKQMESAYKTNKTVLFVESIFNFFSPKELVRRLEAGELGWDMIAEHFKITVSPTDANALRKAVTIRAALAKAAEGVKPPYLFAKVPEGFDITKVFELCNGGKSLRRKNGHHQLSLMQAQLIWRYLAEAWINGRSVESKYFREHRVFQLDDNTYRIGCQEAKRHEIEQIAIWQGWDFPNKV